MIINMLYRQFYDGFGQQLMIGGVETYIKNLIELFKKNGHEVYVYQFSIVPFENTFLGATIIGVSPNSKLEHMYKNRIRAMVNESYKRSDPNQDMLVFCTENDIIETQYKKVIAIQHGIGWDVHNLKANSLYSVFKYWVVNSKRAFSEYAVFKKCNMIVCVDYNFINWYRACIHDDRFNYKVIPNFSVVPKFRTRDDKENISIIYARRFQTYRGTRIFAEAILKIIEKYPNIYVTIAGDGPEEEFLHGKLDGYKSVTFTRFMPDESIRVHLEYDIAVVPSTASEGTSLSLIEAMAAGCAVICTDVGGLTNIIIDRHNGLIVRPDVNELYLAIEKLIKDDVLRRILSKRGYETIKDSFDIDTWSKKWMEVVNAL